MAQPAQPHLAVAKSAHFPLLTIGTIALFSGVAGLGYQMLWSRLLAVALGHEVAAVLAVVAAFFVGLALGALLLNSRLRSSARPAHWYAGLELIIAVWALVLVWLVPAFNAHFPLWLGATPAPERLWLFSFMATFLLLAPATVAMGATLPALTRMAVLNGQGEQQVGRIYALNTLGAVAGTLLMTFYWMPSLGLRNGLFLLAAINLCCAVAAWQFGRNSHHTLPQTSVPVQAKTSWALLLACFVTGLLGIGYEVVGIRVLSQVLENTVYSFAVILACYLFFNALGAAFYQRYCARRATAVYWSRFLSHILMATAVACAFGLAAFYWLEPVYFSLRGVFGHGNWGGLMAELLTAAWVFALPTFSMGILFCHLAERAVGTAGLGKALASNTLGGALAPFCFGLFLLPLTGAQKVLSGIVLSYAFIALIAGWAGSVRERWPAAIAVCFAFIVLCLPIPLLYWNSDMAGDAKLVHYQDGVLASVAVVQSGDERFLKVNNHFTMGSSGTRYSDHRQSHLPLLLHGKPESALYLGLGTGITMEAASYYPGLQVTGVELLPELPALMPQFGVNAITRTFNTVTADARRFVLADTQSYDVIIGEIFHPSRDGAGALYTQEHFAAVKARLAEGGLFAQWLPLFQLDLPTLKTIIATYLHEFPHAQAYLGHLSLQQPILCLIGGEGPVQFRENWLLNNVTYPPLQQSLVRTRLNSDYAVFGNFIAGPEALRQFAIGAPVNTDNFPKVTFDAPGFVYADYQAPAERLKNLLAQLPPAANNLPLAAGNREDFNQRMARYLAARDEFLLTGMQALGSDSAEEMLRITRGPLLNIVRQSADFYPAYRTLLAGAQGLYQENPHAALALLNELEMARPEFPEARELRKRLSNL